MSAGPPLPPADLLALWIHNNNLSLSEDVACLSCLQHSVLSGRVLRDSRESLVDNCDLSLASHSLCPFFFLQADWNQRSRPTSNRKLEPLQANRRNRQDSSSPTVRLNERGLFWRIRPQTRMMNHNPFPHIYDYDIQRHKTPSSSDCKRSDWISFYFFFGSKLPSLKVTPLNGRAFMIGRKKFIHGCVIAPLKWTICSIITL